MSNVIHVSIINSSQVSKIASAFNFGFAREKCKRISKCPQAAQHCVTIHKVSAGSTTLCHDPQIVRQLRVERAWSKSSIHVLQKTQCFLILQTNVTMLFKQILRFMLTTVRLWWIHVLKEMLRFNVKVQRTGCIVHKYRSAYRDFHVNNYGQLQRFWIQL